MTNVSAQKRKRERSSKKISAAPHGQQRLAVERGGMKMVNLFTSHRNSDHLAGIVVERNRLATTIRKVFLSVTARREAPPYRVEGSGCFRAFIYHGLHGWHGLRPEARKRFPIRVIRVIRGQILFWVATRGSAVSATLREKVWMGAQRRGGRGENEIHRKPGGFC